MIYGDYDIVPPSPTLEQIVDDLTVANSPCGHWIQQECPQETNAAMLQWLKDKYPA